MIGVACEGEVMDQLTFSQDVRPPIFQMTKLKTKRVVVTGFGPFRDFAENPSSILIDELEQNGICGVTFELHKITVAYDEVSKKVPELWETHNPDLVVHLGAHSVPHTIKFEQCAFSDGYCADDVNGCTPENNQTGVCVAPGTVLQSSIDCAELALYVNQELGYDGVKYNKLICEKSEDPGRYLCGFSYFLSLNKDASKSLFVHVPPFDGECSKENVAQALRTAINHILQQQDSC